MSGPYDNYNYPQGQGGYPQGQYDQSQQYGQQQSTYGQGSQYGQGPQYGQQEPGFGPPARQDSFGPPQHGGFQHGQQGGQYGMYDASNPQGQPAYYGDNRGYDQYQQQQQYQQQPQYGQGYDPSNPQHQGQVDPNAPHDPNAPEGERGLGGALAGGAAGLFLGKKTGHSFLGSVGGAIMGSLAQDKYKQSSHNGHHGKHSNSSWGGSGKH